MIKYKNKKLFKISAMCLYLCNELKDLFYVNEFWLKCTLKLVNLGEKLMLFYSL